MDNENREARNPFNCLRLDPELETIRAYPPLCSPLYAKAQVSLCLDGISQFQQLILISHASLQLKILKSLNERLKPKPVNAAEY